MTIRTITYDDATHVLMPRRPSDGMLLAAQRARYADPADRTTTAYGALVAAAPEAVSVKPDAQAAQIKRLREALGALVSDINDLASESTGVYGLHLNGDPSPWEELLPGGRIERASAPSQANKEMAMLSSAFQFGIEAGMVASNPCRQVRKNKERPRTRCPSWAEIESFCATAKARGPSSHVIGLMAKFIALTGRRRAEFISMTKADLTADGIRVMYAKGRVDDPVKRGLIEWTPALHAVIDELTAIERPGAVGSVYLWTNRSGQPYTEQGFKAMWSKIMTAWAASGGERFTFHDLRAYYVSVMVERKQNPETHANPATTRKVYDRRRVVKIKSSA